MTRINPIDPQELTDQHLLAAYREHPRVLALARPGIKVPAKYTLGAGHVKFFYPRTLWICKQQALIIKECLDRGFNIQYTAEPQPVPGCDQDWTPTPEDLALNLSRLQERLKEKPGFYTFRGVVVSSTFYDR